MINAMQYYKRLETSILLSSLGWALYYLHIFYFGDIWYCVWYYYSMSPTERTPFVIQLCLRSRIGLWEKSVAYPGFCGCVRMFCFVCVCVCGGGGEGGGVPLPPLKQAREVYALRFVRTSSNATGNITTHHLMSHTSFLPMWGLQIFLFGLQDSLVRRQSMECQLCEDNAQYYSACNSKTYLNLGIFNNSSHKDDWFCQHNLLIKGEQRINKASIKVACQPD